MTFNGIPEGEFNLDRLIEQIMLEEKTTLLGKPYTRRAEHRPWGEQQGYGILNGQKVTLLHPRVRPKDNREVPLESYRKFQQPGNRAEARYEHLVNGISCR